MPIKFLLDEHQKKSEEELKRILELMKKKPYPDRNTTILARFVEGLFEAGRLEAERKARIGAPPPIVLPPKIIIKTVPQVGKPLPPPPLPHKMAEPEVPLPSAYPSPEAPEMLPELELQKPIAEIGDVPKKGDTYTVTAFDTEITVKLDTNIKTGKLEHTMTEPEIDFRVLEEAKIILEADFDKNNDVLEKKDVLMKTLKKACAKAKVEAKPEYLNALQYYLKRDWLGFREVDTLIRDNRVKEIYCDGANKPIKIKYKEGDKLESSAVFEDNDEINLLIKKLAQTTNQKVSEENPILNVRHKGIIIQATMGFGGVSSKFIFIKEEE